MTIQHTAGPWEIQPGFLTVYTYSDPINRVGLTCAIASVNREQPAIGEPEANACLIAAAPDMLAALEKALAHLEYWASARAKNPEQEEQELRHPALGQCRAAIAKAKGV